MNGFGSGLGLDLALILVLSYLVIKDHVVNRSFLWCSIFDVIDKDAFDDQSSCRDTS